MVRKAVEIGISLGVSPRDTFENMIDLIKSAEEYGFDSAWLIDIPTSKDCFISMALAAINTKSIRLGSGVINPITRHPAVSGRGLAAVQELSQGRCLVGLGTGHTDVHMLGRKPGRIKDVEEAITLLQKLFRGEKITNYGMDLQLPVDYDPIPIFLAANQPNMLRLAGKLCDGVILMGGANVEFIKWQMAHVREGAESAGRTLDDIQLDLWFPMSISDDKEQALTDIRPWVASQAETFSFWKDLPDFLEPYRDECARIGAAYDKTHHVSRHAVHKELVSDDLANYLAVAGSAQECVERIEEITSLGIHGITTALLPGDRKDRLRMMSETIIPALV